VRGVPCGGAGGRALSRDGGPLALYVREPRWSGDPRPCLCFAERWGAGGLWSSAVAGVMVEAWVWREAARGSPSGARGCEVAVAAACAGARRLFPELLRGATLRWSRGVGEPGSLRCSWGGGRGCPGGEGRDWSPVRGLAVVAGRLLAVAGADKDGGTVRCSRVSNPAGRERGSRLVFVCSASGGAGLLGCNAFLRMLERERPARLVFPSRSRLGRAGWRGVAEALRAAGVAVGFSEGGDGVDKVGSSDVGRGRRLGEALAGCAVVPAWLGVGVELGRVAVVGPGVVNGCWRRWSPGVDVRLEHLLLRLALEGARGPVHLLGPTSGPALWFRR
jgi:hypothetical protein